MIKQFLLLLMALTSFSSLADISYHEHIKSFDVVITPEKDHLIIVEKIHYNFPNNQRRRGIYRDIITHEKRRVSELNDSLINYNIDLEVIDVSDEQATPYHYIVKSIQNGKRIRIGRKNKFVRGNKVYYITYKVKGVVRFFENHDEIYWNVTGNYWNYTINQASVKIELPEDLSDNPEEHKVFFGSYGSTSSLKVNQTINQDIVAKTTRPLAPGEGLTIAASFKKGYFKELGIFEKWFFYIKANFTTLLLMLLPLFTLLYMRLIHIKHGKEKYYVKAVVVKYDPPEGLSPAEVGTLLDDKVHNSDVTSIILDLAVRGYILIKEVETSHLYLFKTNDYQLVFTDKPTDELKAFEEKTLASLKIYAKTRTNENMRCLNMADLKDRFYRHLKLIKDSLYKSLTKSKYYTGNPEKVRNKYALYSSVMLLGFVLFIVLTPSQGSENVTLYALLSFGLSGVIINIYARYMPRKTRQGFKLYAHSLGFKEFIERVESEDIRRMAQKDPTLFERNLPYAVAMGLADEWADKFKDIHLKSPSWYEGADRYRHDRFTTRKFMRSFGGSLQSIENTISSAPRSSGSSGTSGGGGFSGGGSGGGGGGSW